MNAELTKKALELVGNPNLLVNLVSRRVRQLNSGGGGLSRPLIDPPIGAGLADIALIEIIDGKITFDAVEEEAEPAAETAKPARRRKKAAA